VAKIATTAEEPGGEDEAEDREALDGWGRTARLCVIRLAESGTAALPLLLWLSMRR
jgi:hypothetical protein